MKLTTLALVVLAGFAAIAAGWIYQSNVQPEVSEAELEIPMDIDYYLSGVRYRSLLKSGRIGFELRSPYLEHYKHEDISRVKTPEMDIFRNGQRWQARAQLAELQHQSEILEMIDDVIFERVDNDPVKMLTNLLSFDTNNDIVTGKNGVRIVSETAMINADSGVFNLNQNIYTLNQARAIYYP